MMLADVVLPLAVPGAYTYILPSEMEGSVSVGSRVVVPLGKSKRYTGIVIRLHAQKMALPASFGTHPSGLEGLDNRDESAVSGLKSIEELVDERPLLLEHQINFWRWMAYYYMCCPGEVMKAALPSGLKLESETTYSLSEDFVFDDETAENFPSVEEKVLRSLSVKDKTLADLRKVVNGKGVVTAVRQLTERGFIEVEERVSASFKAKTELHVRLTEAYRSEDSLNVVLDMLAANKRAERQEHTLMTFLEMCGFAAAAALKNENLLQPVPKRELIERVGQGGESGLAALKKKGILETYNVEVGRLKTQKALPGLLERPLSAAQEETKVKILDEFAKNDVVLLHGVTSSGKTEVYIKLIEYTLRAGRQVLYLLPEIALTTQITTRLGKVFGDKLGIYHSKFPDNERVELWQRQLGDRPFPIILGVRSALFLPFQNLGLVIVDEEHETTYKQQDPAPRYHARDAAIVLAKQVGAKVLLGTATPSLESYSNAKSGKYGLVQLFSRYGDVQMPEIVVEDVKELHRKKLMNSPFSPQLSEDTHAALERGEQAIFFQNRRGYSPQLECSKCGWVPYCSKCDVALTFHQRINRLVCHYCGSMYDVPRKCPQCENTELRDVGYGTEKIESAVTSCFPEAKVARMDLDTTRSRSAYEGLIRDFQLGRTNLLIGTQMVTKGLDFDRVSIVGILNADQMLNIPDFRSHERAFQMMAQVAGRAGRRGKQGKVILQTRQPDAPTIRQVVANDYEAMYNTEMFDRQMFRYPPAVRIINIYLKHKHEETVIAGSRALASMLLPFFETDLIGPDRPAVGRVQLQHIRKLMLKVTTRYTAQSIRQTLHSARENLLKMQGFKSLNVFFDVDPL